MHESSNNNDVLDRFRQAISESLGGDVVVATFWKGRVALYAILRCLGVGEGDEVIVPGFTCVVVPNAVIYTGAKPVYADIDPEIYTVRRDTLEPLITKRTKAIVTQNTFGLSPDLDPILDLGNEHGITIIDDCAHGFGGNYKHRPNGVTTDVSFFSTQWNKPMSTGVGGIAATKDQELAEKLRDMESFALPPTRKDVMTLQTAHAARRSLVGRVTYWEALALYRWLGNKGLITGSSQSMEIMGPVMPKEYFKRMSRFQARVGLRAIKTIDDANEIRRNLAGEYDTILQSMDKRIPVRPTYARHSFLKYPIHVTDRSAIMRAARRRRIRLGDWFVSPLHPVEKDLSPWGLHPGSCPVSTKYAQQLVNLPTDPDMSPKEVEHVKSFVKEFRGYIL